MGRARAQGADYNDHVAILRLADYAGILRVGVRAALFARELDGFWVLKFAAE